MQQIGWCVIRVVWREQSREEPSWHRDRRVRSLRLGRMEGSKVLQYVCSWILLCATVLILLRLQYYCLLAAVVLAAK